MNANPIPEPSEQDVQKEAYLLYISSGCVPGRDLENWLTARTHLLEHWQAGRRERVISTAFPELHFPLNANLSHNPFGTGVSISSHN